MIDRRFAQHIGRMFCAAAPQAKAPSARAVPLVVIKEVRARSGAPIGAVKDALVAENGDIESALERLRRDGARLASLRAARETSEGLVGLVRDPSAAAVALVELHCETDFVARTALFHDTLATVTQCALDMGGGDKVEPVVSIDANELLGTAGNDAILSNAVAVLGENVRLGQVSVLRGGCVGGYLHGYTPRPEGSVASDVQAGRIGVAVALSDGGLDAVKIADQLALHVAAETPQYVRRDAVPSSVMDKESDILMEAARGENLKPGAKPRPDDILRKMVDGRLNKWLAEVVLTEQAMLVADESLPSSGKPLSVRKWLQAQRPGTEVVSFTRLAI